MRGTRGRYRESLRGEKDEEWEESRASKETEKDWRSSTYTNPVAMDALTQDTEETLGGTKEPAQLPINWLQLGPGLIILSYFCAEFAGASSEVTWSPFS